MSFQHLESNATHAFNIKVKILKNNGKASEYFSTGYIYNDIKDAQSDEKLFLWYKNDKRVPLTDRLKEIRLLLPISNWSIIPVGELWDEARDILKGLEIKESGNKRPPKTQSYLDVSSTRNRRYIPGFLGYSIFDENGSSDSDYSVEDEGDEDEDTDSDELIIGEEGEKKTKEKGISVEIPVSHFLNKSIKAYEARKHRTFSKDFKSALMLLWAKYAPKLPALEKGRARFFWLGDIYGFRNYGRIKNKADFWSIRTEKEDFS